MFRTRSKLQRRDRDSGLVFSWRVPLTSSAAFVVAVLLVGGVSVALATLVRVKIGVRPNLEVQRGSVVLVSSEEGGDWLESMAIEAGPYPFRWNPAADPEYAALRGQALREASGGSLPYAPETVVVEVVDFMPRSEISAEVAFLPPLPEAPETKLNGEPKETTLGIRVVRSGKGPSLQLPRLPLEAKDAVAASGRRFLIGFQEDGRVSEVIPFNQEESPADLIGWLGRARVVDHDGKSGWLPVESTVEP